MKRDNGAFYNNADQKNGKAEPLPWNGTKKKQPHTLKVHERNMFREMIRRKKHRVKR